MIETYLLTNIPAPFVSDGSRNPLQNCPLWTTHWGATKWRKHLDLGSTIWNRSAWWRFKDGGSCWSLICLIEAHYERIWCKSKVKAWPLGKGSSEEEGTWCIKFLVDVATIKHYLFTLPAIHFQAHHFSLMRDTTIQCIILSSFQIPPPTTTTTCLFPSIQALLDREELPNLPDW